MLNQGVFVVLEGSDGSGKATQLKLLAERLKAIGYDVVTFDFPRYHEPSSHFVRQYLEGAYGTASDVNPYTASLFYALDRYEASSQIKDSLSEGKIVLSNRYVGANMAHQGSKFTNEGEQRGFFIWEDGLEYNLLKIPRPTTTLFLRVPAKTSIELIKKRAERTGQKLDEHERDEEHLRNTVATYDLLCRLFPRDFKPLDCTKNGRLLSVTEINELIWKHIKPLLPDTPPNKARSRSLVLDTSLEKANEARRTGKTASPRRQSDSTETNNKIFRLKNLSLLATSFIEATGEVEIKSTPVKDSFYSLSGVPKRVKSSYDEKLNNIINIKKELRSGLSDHFKRTGASNVKTKVDRLIQPLTPLASLTDLDIAASETKINSLINKLHYYQLEELNFTADQLSIASQKFWPESETLRRSSAGTEEPEHLRQALSAVASKLLASGFSGSTEVVTLVKATPRNELDLISDELYQFSNVGGEEVMRELDSLSYEEKSTMLLEMLSDGGLAVANSAIYNFDLISDFASLKQLIKGSNIKNVRLQAPTPRYGFEVPKIIEEAGLDDRYNKCFDLSLEMFSIFQAAGKESLAAYSCLYGHKVRWQFSISAGGIVKTLKSVDAGPRLLLDLMVEHAAQSHPLTGRYIKESTVDDRKRRGQLTRTKSSVVKK